MNLPELAEGRFIPWDLSDICFGFLLIDAISDRLLFSELHDDCDKLNSKYQTKC
jgi:hypothetical protein